MVLYVFGCVVGLPVIFLVRPLRASSVPCLLPRRVPLRSAAANEQSAAAAAAQRRKGSKGREHEGNTDATTERRAHRRPLPACAGRRASRCLPGWLLTGRSESGTGQTDRQTDKQTASPSAEEDRGLGVAPWLCNCRSCMALMSSLLFVSLPRPRPARLSCPLLASCFVPSDSHSLLSSCLRKRYSRERHSASAENSPSARERCARSSPTTAVSPLPSLTQAHTEEPRVLTLSNEISDATSTMSDD
jgi:hypothetical protein